ncbi:MAG: hypothetical protein KDA92_07185, partial [Planctomycetales bacterium]|nr:hypothetical protein [Planctomycetales bacterium]
MRRRLARNLLIAASLTQLAPDVAFAQIFARQLPAASGEMSNAACTDAGCSPQWPYGYFQEHWRRWPEEHIPPVRPDAPRSAPSSSTVPSADTPDPRDEMSIMPRNRQATPKMSAPGMATP